MSGNDRDSITLEEGTVVGGRYEVMNLLDRGGFGAVYKARQKSTGQLVAIKVLNPERLKDRGRASIETARFEREMKLIAKLKHPNIVRLVDSGLLPGGDLFTVLEFIEGETLSSVLEREGRLDPGEARHLMTQVLDALVMAHEKGIVHCDLKPGNIMVTSGGGMRNAVVLDFGISSVMEEHRDVDYKTLTEEGTVRGTPAYMAPEQLHNEKVTPRTDIYAWGLVFLESLTGEAVFDFSSYAQVIFAQMSQDEVPIPRALASHPLGRIIKKAVEKRVERRYRSARDALGDLAKVESKELRFKNGVPSAVAFAHRRTVDESDEALRNTLQESGEDLQSDSQFNTTLSPSGERRTVDESHLEEVKAEPSRKNLLFGLAALLIVGGGTAALAFGFQDSSQEKTADASASSAEDSDLESVTAAGADAGSSDGGSAGDAPIKAEPAAPIPLVKVPAASAEIGLTTGSLERYQDLHQDSDYGFDLDHSAGVMINELWQRPALEVSRNEVSWGQWNKYKGTAKKLDEVCDSPLPESGPHDHPVSGVGAAEAAAWCEGIGMRLPTTREWEALARGGVGRPYAFVGELTDSRRAELKTPGPVGQSRWNVTPAGVQDLTGSVFEWVTCEKNKPPYCVDGYMFRGGSHAGDPVHDYAFAAPYMGGESPQCLRRDDVGFRCVVDAD